MAFLRTTFAFLLFTLAPSSFGEEHCVRDALKAMLGREDATVIAAKVSEPDQMKYDKFSFGSIAGETPDPNALYIGVANTANSGSHHYYIVINGIRYDGLPQFSKGKVKVGKLTSPIFSKGVVFKIKLPEEAALRVMEEAAKAEKLRSLTCLHGACKMLKRAEVSVGDLMERGSKIRSKKMGEALIQGDVKYKGKTVELDGIHFYATSDAELDHFLNKLQTVDKEAWKGQLTMAAPYAVATGAPSVGVGAMVSYHEQMAIIMQNPEAASKNPAAILKLLNMGK